jgi:8-oxo-dGTP diphosphatase
MPYTYTFCPKCATRLELRDHEGRELPTCPSCAFTFYNNAAPCVGVFVIQEGAVLLAKRAVEPFLGWWDVPGGFLESSEHPETGAKRELLEETGLSIEPTELLGFWPDVYGPSEEPTLNIAYVARIVGGGMQAGDDASELAWIPLKALPERIAFNWVREALEVLVKRLSP